MWQAAFVATSVALGLELDDALAVIGHGGDDEPGTMRMPVASKLDDLVAGLRAPSRAVRAHALANALKDIVVAADGLALE